MQSNFLTQIIYNLNYNNDESIYFNQNFFSNKDILQTTCCYASIINKYNLEDQVPIIIYIKRTYEYVPLILSCFYTRHPIIPLDYDTPLERVKQIYSQFDKVFIITTPSKKKFFCSSTDIENFSVFASTKYGNYNSNKLNETALNWKKKDILYIMFTSGTTGKPKQINISFGSFNNFIFSFRKEIDLKEIKSILAITSVGFDIHFVEILFPLVFGANIILASQEEYKNIEAIRRLILERKPEIIQLTPSRLELILEKGKSNIFNIPKIILIGGEDIPEKLLLTVQKQSKGKIYNVYGPTETTIWSMINDVTSSRIVLLGHPLKGERVLVERNNNEIKEGKGELFISGKGLGSNLDSNEIKTIHKTKWFKTGDIVSIHNNSIKYIGRKSSFKKVNGYRISSAEIESNLNNSPNVLGSKVLFIKNQIIAYVKVNEYWTKKSTFRYLKDHIPKYMLPSNILKSNSLYLNNNGKLAYDKGINKKIFHQQVKTVTVEDKVEEFLKSINIIGINPNSSIEYMGLDSMNYLLLIITIENTFKIKFTETELPVENYVTLNDLIKKIKEKIKLLKGERNDISN